VQVPHAGALVGSPSTGRLRLSNRPAPEGEGHVTAQGHPRAIFNRAIERGNLLVAETTARQMGRVSPVEALDLSS
jgi:hypothetical protein